MPVTTYTTIQGEIVSENRNGVKRDYLPDPLGNTIALLDANQQKTDTFSYWPYGELKSRTGTTPTSFQFGGTAGYHTGNAQAAYVRARYLLTRAGRWSSSDPLWMLWPQARALPLSGDCAAALQLGRALPPRAPHLSSTIAQPLGFAALSSRTGLQDYGYTQGNPTSRVDPSGLDWLDCMARCIQTKDIFRYTWQHVGFWVCGGAVPKFVLKLLGLRVIRQKGSSWYSLLPSAISSHFNFGARSVTRKLGRGIHRVWVAYGLYLAGVEAACAGTCLGDPDTEEFKIGWLW